MQTMTASTSSRTAEPDAGTIAEERPPGWMQTAMLNNIRNLFDDGWLGASSLFELTGPSQIELAVYLPPLHSDRMAEPVTVLVGEFYVSFNEGPRLWNEAVAYGLVSADDGSWYGSQLQKLDPGDRIWVKISGAGFVGVGRKTGSRVSTRDFLIGDQRAAQSRREAIIEISSTILTSRDLPPGCPKFITRVLGVDSCRFRVGQARRARSPQIAQASGALLLATCCPVRNAV
jgi:hypothetical protein